MADPGNHMAIKRVSLILSSAVFLLLGLTAGAYYWWWRPAPAAPTALVSPPPPRTDADRVVDTAPQELLPALDESDPWVHGVVAELSSHPRLLAWVASEPDLIRVMVAATDRVAHGASPRRQLAALAPEGSFQATTDDRGHLVPAGPSFTRYDLIADIVNALDTESAALAYQRLRPLLGEAYGEIAPPGSRFDQALARAIAELLAVPAIESPELEATLEGYRYRDPRLEALSPAQKHLLRMGAANVRRLQAKLSAFAQAADLPAPETGASR